MTKRISRQGPGRPPIGAEAMTGAQREARRKQRIAERLQIARAAAVAAASAVEKAADALQGAAGGSQGGQEAYGVRKAVQSLREAHEAVLAAVARR